MKPAITTITSHMLSVVWRPVRVDLWTALVVLVVGSALAASSSASESKPAAAGRIIAKGVTVPLYAPNQTRAAIVLRAEQVSRDYQRRSFFRIGLLPVLAFSGVTIEFRDPEHAKDVLSRVTSRLPVGSAVSAEGRGRTSTSRCGKAG